MAKSPWVMNAKGVFFNGMLLLVMIENREHQGKARRTIAVPATRRSFSFYDHWFGHVVLLACIQVGI
jgi:hypothetical protein